MSEKAMDVIMMSVLVSVIVLFAVLIAAAIYFENEKLKIKRAAYGIEQVK